MGSTVASQQEGPSFDSQQGWSSLCEECLFGFAQGAVELEMLNCH